MTTHELLQQALTLRGFVSTDIDAIEEKAMAQLANVMNLPFLMRVAVLPDIHMGYGVPIGSVVATKPNIVIPNAVGVDIGCGMAAVRTNCHVSELDDPAVRDKLRAAILDKIPVGFHRRAEPVALGHMPLTNTYTGVIEQHMEVARKSMGTLGGGNHFIEIQADDQGNVWVMIHSGSRNLGKQVCDFYNGWAKHHNSAHYSKVEPEWDLAFIPSTREAYPDYMKDMKYCIEYARCNRAYMMEEIRWAFAGALGLSSIKMPWGEMHDICHNQATIENHLGHNMMIHRKGAAGPYFPDTVGIIPGSQGTSSYIVMYRDDADPRALRTTSHGAGRALGRKAAIRGLDLDTELKKMDGICHGITCEDDLQEAVGAYKDIDEVMKAQEHLCVITTKLRPLIAIKAKKAKR
jgi:tRNA-splicing ligase RtcB